MFNININPVAFNLGSIEVRWYGIMIVLAVIAVLIIAAREAKRVGLRQDHIYNIGLWAIIGGLILSRLLHVIDQWGYYMAHPDQIIGFAGLTVYGAVLGALIAALVYCHLKKITFWQVGDILAPGAILGQAIGRIGCLINGCCYGLPSALPWSVIYSNPASYCPLNEPFQPTQIYHMVWDLVGFGIIWSLRTKVKPTGSLFLLYLAIYAAGDLSIRFVRSGEPFLFGMQQAQLIGVLMLLITVPWLIVRTIRYRAQQRRAASAS